MSFLPTSLDRFSLSITFPIPDLHQHYKTAPGHYLGHLIGHEGQGSLLSELKSRGWASNLVGGEKEGAKGFGFFYVKLDLSEEGIKHVDEIVSLVFQYIKMLKRVGPQEWIFEECKNLSAMQFRFKDRERPQNAVTNSAANMHDFPMREVLNGGYVLSEWKPELIEMVLSHLNVENVRLGVTAQQFGETATRTEPWYGTKFKVERIPREKLEEWENAEIHPNLHLPARNPFIPTDFELVARDDVSLALERPEIVHETPLARLWYKQDGEFHLPKLCLNFELKTPKAYENPHSANMTALFVSLFRDSLNEYAYDAELAGLHYSLSNTKHGVNLYLRGYNEKQGVLLKKVLEKLTHFAVNSERFKVLKENYERGLKNFKMEQPHNHAVYYSSCLLSQRTWQKGELLDALPQLTLGALQEFIPRLFSRVHVEALVHGNVTKSAAVEMVREVEMALSEGVHAKPLTPQELLKDREIQLERGTHNFIQSTTEVHKSSCLEIYYQTGPQSTRDNAVLDLLAQIVQEPCFDELRTKQQLGYIVFSGVRRGCGVQGLRIIVQSDRHPAVLDQRVEEFLAGMEDALKEMPSEEFEMHKQALSDRRLEKPKKLYGRCSEYWSEIVNQQLNFDRDQIEVNELQKVSKEDVLAFLKENVLGEKRRKLAAHVLSVTEDGAAKTEPEAKLTDSRANLIEDPVEFKASRPLHPMMRPYLPRESFKRQMK